ncbi:hypothetical protein [Corynebacterium sp. CNJ-954]|uniref:hypothetical protein n=1 Tax=Corynebacterium sp. CNJ-954 TaxID=1904962 RepID=UPI0021014EFA|nr:hypothetical protein [Corynebacterium sp. CNJ-954]
MATVALALAVVPTLLAGCSAADESTPDGSSTARDGDTRVFAEPDDGAFPVTLDHAYGETTIEEQAERVVVVGWAGADLAVQLGTVPVAQGVAGGEGDSADYHPGSGRRSRNSGLHCRPPIHPGTGRGRRRVRRDTGARPHPRHQLRN